MQIRERPPLRLHVDAVAPNGRHFRWGSDEPDPTNVPSGLRFSSTMPGGFESMDCELPRKSGVVYPDLERLSTLRAIGAGGDVAWEGRLERAPRVSGEKLSVSPSAVGWQAALEDNKAVRANYVDRDLGGWHEPSGQRREVLLGGVWNRAESGGSEPDATTGIPGLLLKIQGAQADTAFTEVESWYDGVDEIESIYYDYIVTGGTAAELLLQSLVASDDIATVSEGSGDLYGTATGSGYFTPATARRWAFWQFRNVAAWADEAERIAQIRRLAVFCNHGLTKRGTVPEQGFWASDVIADAVTRFAPLLKVDTSLWGGIQPSSWVLLQMAFRDLTTVAEIIRQANRFELKDWAVWEDREFFFHDRGARGNKWRARIGPAQLEETGPQVDRVWESICVQWNDGDGSTRSVGPPGSGADAEDAALKDDDPENPATKLGTPRRDLLTIGTATQSSAIESGRRFLELSKLLDNSGRAQLVGHVEDDRGVLHPAWRVRAGDQISFTDAADKSYRRIVKEDYAHDSRAASIDIDAPPEGLDALLEQLGAALVPLGLG